MIIGLILFLIGLIPIFLFPLWWHRDNKYGPMEKKEQIYFTIFVIAFMSMFFPGIILMGMGI